MKTAIDLIKEERQSQIEKHGYSAEFHKANPEWYADGQLVQAASFCVNSAHNEWPEGWKPEAAEKIKSKDEIGRLACAGAFLLAQLEVFGKNDGVSAYLGRVEAGLNLFLKREAV